MNTTDAPPAQRPRLLRALGPLMATAVVVGTVIGSGVFKKPQEVATHLPFSGLAALVWVLGGLLALLGALTIAEVAVLYPKAGGNYVFLREAYGRLGGFLWGWVEFVIIKSASIAALASVFTEQLRTVLGEIVGRERAAQIDPWFWYGLTVAVIMALALVNVRGVRWGGLLQLLITLVKVGSLLAILVLPFVVAALVTSVASPVQPGYLLPVLPAGLGDGVVLVGKFGAALLAVLWAYHGWMNVAPVAEEIRQPQRNIPLALLGGVGIIIVLYLGANLAYYLVIPQEAMARMKDTAEAGIDTTVAIGFSRALLGSAGVAVAAAVVACSVFGALNGNLLVGPRVLYAMGEDRLAPRLLSEVHPTYRTPAVAILVMGLWASLLVVGVAMLRHFNILKEDRAAFDVLTDFVMFGAVIFETLAVSSIFVFRRRLAKAERPYRCWGYPVVPVVYIGIMALVVCNTLLYRTFEATAALGFVAVGAIVYAIFLDRPGCLKEADTPGQPAA